MTSGCGRFPGWPPLNKPTFPRQLPSLPVVCTSGRLHRLIARGQGIGHQLLDADAMCLVLHLGQVPSRLMTISRIDAAAERHVRPRLHQRGIPARPLMA